MRGGFEGWQAVKVKDARKQIMTTIRTAFRRWFDGLERLTALNSRLDILRAHEDSSEVMLESACSFGAIDRGHQLVIFRRQRCSTSRAQNSSENVCAVCLAGGCLWRHLEFARAIKRKVGVE